MKKRLDTDGIAEITKLIECDALEIVKKDGILWIPYMMNDAVECFYTFYNVVTQGQWDNHENHVERVEFVEEACKNGLILYQTGNVFSIWYESVEKQLTCYQYHRILHTWVEGQEEWRRLVYILGTVYDKKQYLGNAYCTMEEEELIQLMEFAPFRYWSPIHESLDAYYPDTKAGLDTMISIAQRVQDSSLVKHLQRYAKLGNWQIGRTIRVKKMAKELLKSRHQEILEYLNRQIEMASLHYEARIYAKELQERMEQLRQNVERQYQERGYRGCYPCMMNDREHVLCYEEHPYVMNQFEYENYHFCVHTVVKTKINKRKTEYQFITYDMNKE